jgi:DNA-directed RNA polymerase specialized sigma24 family protein
VQLHQGLTQLVMSDREIRMQFERGAALPQRIVIKMRDAQRIPAPFRETLVLRDLQDLSYREIAGVTQVPVGTVMSRLARARGRLTGPAGLGDGLH